LLVTQSIPIARHIRSPSSRSDGKPRDIKNREIALTYHYSEESKLTERSDPALLPFQRYHRVGISEDQGHRQRRTNRSEFSTPDRSLDAGSTDATAENSRPLVTCFATRENAQAMPTSLTAPNVEPTLPDQQRATDTKHTKNARRGETPEYEACRQADTSNVESYCAFHGTVRHRSKRKALPPKVTYTRMPVTMFSICIGVLFLNFGGYHIRVYSYCIRNRGNCAFTLRSKLVYFIGFIS
jgi:hypothetical protein